MTQHKGLLSGAIVALLCLFTWLVGPARGDAGQGLQDARLAIEQLQKDFHGASTLGDYDLMKSIWAEDGVFMGGGNTIVGPENIADFFAAGAGWGRAASLAPSYKTQIEIRGNHGTLRFECVIVFTGDADPLETSLGSIPPGSQNPDVEIVQHSNATCDVVKERGRWVIASFKGALGPMQ